MGKRLLLGQVEKCNLSVNTALSGTTQVSVTMGRVKCKVNGSTNSFSTMKFPVIFSIIVILGFVQVGLCQEPACCEQVGGSCAQACKQLSLVSLAAETNPDAREKQLRPIQMLCPSQMESFWECMNQTKTALLDGAGWEGRFCCSMAQTRLCQISCLTAQRSSDLVGGCRRSDENAVYHCLARQEAHENCCRQSKKPECSMACRNFLRADSPQQNRRHGLKKRLNSQCERDQVVLNCVSNLTHATPIQNPERNIPCCARGRSAECQEACRRVLKTANSDMAVMETLVEKGCGHPRPDDKMWQCFLQNAEPRGTELPSKIDRLGMDAAKLHCCHRANNPTCRRLCHKTYSREWTGSWTDYDRLCLSSPTERALRDCVEEVEEPCELGCDGLNFCSAFNNRPSDLFRRCNPPADMAARQQFEQWKSLGYIPFLDNMKLPLKDLSQCATEKWKAVACALQLRPCHPKNHVSMICRSDCNSLLHECVDMEQVSRMAGGYDVTSICELLSPPPGNPCISLSSYIQQPKSSKRTGIGFSKNSAAVDYQVLEPQITRPCKSQSQSHSQPCNTSEICEVNRKCLQGGTGSGCEPYTCSVGCSLGEVSRLVVAPNTWVRVPTEKPGCQRLCRCSEDGRIDHCSTSMCEPPAPCWLGRNHFDHGSHFWLDCNLCSCRAGELICSKRQCMPAEDSGGYLFTPAKSGTEVALPCNCHPTWSPVCGSNGRTYPSECLAKCGGLMDAEIFPGECVSKDPCEGVSCGNGRRCIRSKKICLIPLARQCQQFQCVPLKCEDPWESWHKSSNHQPACDTSGREHRNLCSLTTSGAMLAYMGSCLRSGCAQEGGPVCGIDGETYPSECAAEVQGIPKDYSGPCRFIGTGDGSHLEPSCIGEVDCPQLPENCVGVTPSGACCPICGGVLRVIYSPTQVLRLAETSHIQLITVDEISKRLNSLIQTAQCRAGAYLGLGTEIVVVVRPVSKTWSRVQLQACISESERLAAFITQQNPIVQVDASLSVLMAAATNHISSGASTLLYLNTSFTFVVIVVSIVFSKLLSR